MGWKFCWVSSYKSEFNYDFHVSFRPEEVAAGKTIYGFREKKIGPETFTLSGHSVFTRMRRAKSFARMARSGAGASSLWGCMDISMGCRRGARST
jgi:predicted dithiol-disulfide oxidoreductase (DUF899 family)